MVHMRRTSLVKAKAHLSELVDEAQHRGHPVIILRHGKPAAALVPVELAIRPSIKAALDADEAERRLDELARVMTRGARARGSAVRDLLDGRR